MTGFWIRRSRFLVLVAVSIAAIVPLLEAQDIAVFITPFRNESENASLDVLGEILSRDISLAVALLDGFELVPEEDKADVRISTGISLESDGVYRALGTVVQSGETLASEEIRFESVFDVFDTGGEIGERLLSTYTNRVLEFASLAIRPSRIPEDLVIQLDGQRLDNQALQLDRVLAGSWELSARFSEDDPFFLRTIVLQEGDEVTVELEVPGLRRGDLQTDAEEALAAFLSNDSSDGTDSSIDGTLELLREFDLPVPVEDDRVEPVVTATENHDAIQSRRVLPRLRDGVVSVDGAVDDWRSVPFHVEATRSSGRGRGAYIASGRFAHDSERFYGLVEYGLIDRNSANDGEGIEVSVYVPGTGDGSGEGIVNITMAIRSGNSVYLAAYKNPRDGSADWSTAYRSSSAAVFRDRFFEFSVPAGVIGFSGVEANSAGIPERISVDVESGVTLEGSDGFDYALYGNTGRRTLRSR